MTPKFKTGENVYVQLSNKRLYFTVTEIKEFSQYSENQKIGYLGPQDRDDTKTTYWFEFAVKKASKLEKALL